jgi:hypothetical protein
MELRNEVMLMNGNKVSHTEIEVELKEDGSTDHEVKCFCMYCRTAYKERPMICRCSSNAFLRNVVNGIIE